MAQFPRKLTGLRVHADCDQAYAGLLDGISFQPVFVTGMHRSGTTILYRLLSATGRFNFTTLYDVHNHYRLLHLHHHPKEAEAAKNELRDLLAAGGELTRQYDHSRVGPDETEEYAWALVPQERRPMLNETTMPNFLAFARKLQYLQDPHRPLLLKNPYDVTLFAWHAEVLSGSRFALIHRNPIETIQSQMNMFKDILYGQNAYEMVLSESVREMNRNPMQRALLRIVMADRFGLLFRLVLRRVAEACDYICDNYPKLANVATGVRYRDLCREPEACVRRILAFLELPPPTTEIDYRAMVRVRTPSLLPVVRKNRALIENQTRRYREMFGV